MNWFQIFYLKDNSQANDALNNAVSTGFKLSHKRNPVLEAKLKANVAVFSAFKAHHQTKEIQDALLDEKGEPRTFSEFKKRANVITKNYNQNWLKTEYNTALARARTAEKFDRFKANAHLYPNIEWVKSRSATPRDSHRNFYGIVRPVGDSFWTVNYLGNIWNCKCGLKQTKKRATKVSKAIQKTIDSLKPKKGIDVNPSLGEIFTETSPFRKTLLSQKKEKIIKKKANKLQLKAEQKASLAWAKKNIDAQKGLTIKSSNLVSGKVNIRRGSIKEILFHNKDVSIAAYTRIMTKYIKDWQYVGWKPVLRTKKEKLKHPTTLYFLYYKVKINGQDRYVNVRYDVTYGEVPYAIMDSIKDVNKGRPKK